MAESTKERILRMALELFAQNGYLGTSMNDIAGQLGFTKAALYKHYASKQEILDKIVERMNKMDYERAEVYEMPETGDCFYKVQNVASFFLCLYRGRFGCPCRM